MFGKSRTSLELLDVPASFVDRLDPDVGSRTHVSRMLDKVRLSLHLDSARSPGFHGLQIIYNERSSRILQHILVLHCVSDVPAADIDVLAVSIEANRSNIRPPGF